MNPFNKNPFANTNNTKIVGNNIHFDEKQKLDSIKEKMAKLKFQTTQEVPEEKPQNNQQEQSLADKIDNLKNINRWN